MGFQACFSSYRSCGSLQVKEFLERISKRISVLAAKELTKLRAMKVKKYESNKTWLVIVQ